MPNYCSNQVSFQCSRQTLGKLKRYFLGLAKKEKSENSGQVPEFFQGDPGFLFEIRWSEDVLYFDTRWGPYPEVMISVAEHFKADFILSYQELNMQIYGEFSFIKGISKDLSLDESDFDQFDVNPNDEDTWLFEGEVYQSDFEIMDILLDRKKINPL